MPAALGSCDMRDSRGMRVLVCPDKFAGTLSAPAAAQAIAQGWREGAPADEVTVRPVSDGGPGFLDVLAAALPHARRHPVATTGLFGEPVAAEILVDGATAYVEQAQAAGLALVPPQHRDPMAATTYGVGVLIAAAVRLDVRLVVVGLGGSATVDGGAGMLAALGAPPVDDVGTVLAPGGGALRSVARLNDVPHLGDVTLIGACDVENPLVGPTGAAAVFGPQKGAGPDQVTLLDEGLTRLAEVLQRLPGCPPALATIPGAGAGGGVGAAILACGGRLVSGFDLVRDITALDAALDACDLVITGEGSFDDQSLHGKAVSGVAAAARSRGIDCIVLAGRATVDASAARAAGVSEAYSLVDHFGGDLAHALADTAQGLRSLARRRASRAAG